MSSIGIIIKQTRLSNNIKQANLVKGICSPSYLSKVENNVITPKKDILNLLLKKLNIELTETTIEDESHYISSLFQMYKEAVLKRDRFQVKKSLNKFSEQSINFSETSNYYYFQLYMFRIRLICSDNAEKLSEHIRVLFQLKENFNFKQLFLYHLNVSLYYYKNKQYNQALSQLKNSLQIVNDITIEDWELADYYNALSICYSIINDHFNALTFATISSNYFNNYQLNERKIDNYIIIGNAHQNLLDYKSAEKNFHLAQQTAKKLNNKEYEGIIYHNLGSMYAMQDKHLIAVENFKLSFSYKQQKKQYLKSLPTILCIVQEYAKHDNSQQVINWCQKALETLSKVPSSTPSHESYTLHFEIFKTIYQKDGDLEQIFKKAIKYFENVRSYRYVQKYSIMFGDYFFENNKFKKASIYYQKANKFLYLKNSIKLEEM
ncbi:helix-turn-helix domain-containing protein [Psychrobacillus sp. BM2]|uniref:helix-turn-helix domain-containing protein n=1 Tax=Psychrobacillus sp. BM2 TaxID=3400421 RepID=UPI003B021D72